MACGGEAIPDHLPHCSLLRPRFKRLVNVVTVVVRVDHPGLSAIFCFVVPVDEPVFTYQGSTRLLGQALQRDTNSQALDVMVPKCAISFAALVPSPCCTCASLSMHSPLPSRSVLSGGLRVQTKALLGKAFQNLTVHWDISSTVRLFVVVIAANYLAQRGAVYWMMSWIGIYI